MRNPRADGSLPGVRNRRRAAANGKDDGRAGQALLHVNTGVLHWAIIATAVWALLNVVISLDPAIRDKIDTARSLAQTISEARRGNG